MLLLACRTLGRLLSPVPQARRHLHTSLVALGGRNDGNLATQGLGAHSSRPVLSKKAKKRAKSRREALLRHPRGGMEGGGGEAGALAAGYPGGARGLEVSGKEGLVASEEEEEAMFQGLTQASVRNRVAIESMLYSQPSPPRAGDVLRGEDGAAWVQHAKGFGVGGGKEGGQAWARAIRVFGAQGRFDAALGAFREMQRCGVPPTVYTYSALLGVCGNGTGAKEVWGALQRDVREGVVREAPTGVAWGAYIQAHVRGGDLEGALGALKEAGEAGVPLSTTLWTHVIVGANRVGLYATAEACFHQMRTFHVQPDAVAFTALIHSYARRDMYEAARNVLWDMRDSGTPPTAVTYNALTYAAARSWRSCDEAHGVAASMAAAGFQKDAYTLTALLLACSQRGDVGRAREYVGEWVGQGGELSRDIFNNLITVYARALKKGVLPPGQGASLPSTTSTSTAFSSATQVGIGSSQAWRTGQVATRGGGGELLQLDAQGALSTPGRVYGDEVRRVFGKDGAGGASEARLVDPLDPGKTAERLLADYYGVAVVEEGVEEREAEERGDEGPAFRKFLQDLPQEWQDVDSSSKSPEYRAGTRALVEAGILDRESMEAQERWEEEEEEGVFAGLEEGGEEELKRDRAIERAERRRVESLEEEAVELAEREEELRAKLAQLGEGGGGEGVLPLPMTSFYSEVVDRVMEVTAGDGKGGKAGSAASAGVGSGSGSSVAVLPASPPSTSSQVLLSAFRQGKKVSMKEYMLQLEREVMTEAFGPEWVTDDEDEGEVGEDGGIRGGGERGGAAVASSKSGGGGSEKRLRRNWMGLLATEEEAESPQATIGGVPLQDLFDASTVPLPTPTSIGGTVSGDYEDVDPLKLYAHISSHLTRRVGAALVTELGGRVSGDIKDLKTFFDNPYLSDAEEEGEGEGGKGAPLPQSQVGVGRDSQRRNHRSFSASVLARLMAVHPLGPLERDLVVAAEGVEKYRKRRVEGTTPGILDALFSVQRLRAKALGVDLPPPREHHSAGEGGSPAYSARKAASEAKHDARVKESIGRVVAMVQGGDDTEAGAVEGGSGNPSSSSSSSSNVSERLDALKALSTKTFGPGAVWLNASPYPSSPRHLRARLLTELHRIYHQELPRAGITPDTVTLNATLSALCASGAMEAATAFLRTAYPAQGLTPDVGTYRAWVGLLCSHAPPKQRSADAGLAALGEMKAAGLGSDPQCVGLVVHALAREWRLEEAVRVVAREKEEGGVTISEHFAKLLRSRCKEAGVKSQHVPEHPAGWQFTPEVMAKRMDKSWRTKKSWRWLQPKL